MKTDQSFPYNMRHARWTRHSTGKDGTGHRRRAARRRGDRRRLHAAGANVMLHYRASDAEARALQQRAERRRADSVALIQADLLNGASLPDLVKTTVKHSAASTRW